MDKGPTSSKLDWKRMLGFEQIAEERDSIREATARTLNPKVGKKIGEKLGVKVGTKIGAKTGLKA